MAAWNPEANDIFLKAVAIPAPDDRRAYLDEACRGDALLRGQVEALLTAGEQAGSFLESPAAGLTAAIDSSELSEQPGALIGPYKLLEQIGEGGMGVVYMADQQAPVRRRVALKIIKPGMDTRQVIARFEAERQALAVMDHVNIARVLDVGATDSGRPYFVMELVRGVPITTFCDENNLPVRERLELFASVCQAIQHAHTKGIVHRDIKPSNVLVTRQDGRAVVKVIDFGVAKAMGQQLTEKTLFTNFAQMIGTPLYMSPEQAEQSGVDIDTRSDIFSLGVLLYELLTGTTPVDADQFKQAAVDEIRRIIREDEPQTPSARISGSHTLPSVAANRHTEPSRLSKAVRGELDWIVMKALEKDRNRRYETASSFAADIERHLHDEPVEAGPPSAVYRFRKFARRNKGPVAAVAAVLLALVLGLALSTIGFIQASRQRAIAQSNAARADREADHASAESQKHAVVNNFLYDLLRAIEPAQLPPDKSAKDVTLLQVLDDASRFLDTGALKQNPQAEELVRTSLSMTYRDVGQIDVAERHARVALERAREAYGSRHAKVAERALDVHYLLREQGKLTEAKQFADEAVAIGMATPDKKADLIRHLVPFLEKEGRFAEAEQLSREALAIARRTYGDGFSEDVVKALLSLADTLNAQQKFAEADANYREALEMQRGQLSKEHPDVVRTVDKLVANLEKQGKWTEAEQVAREGLELAKQAYGPKHPNVADRMHDVYRVLEGQEKWAEAEPFAREALDLAKQAYGPKHPNVADCMHDVYKVLEKQGKWPEAEPFAREALELIREVYGPGHPRIADRLDDVYGLLRNQGNLTEAEQLIREAIAIGEGNPLRNARRVLDLSELLMQQGKLLEAEKLYGDATAHFRKLVTEFPKVPEYRARLAYAHNGLGGLLRASSGRLQEAEKEHRLSLALFQELAGEFPNDPEYRHELGRSLNGLGIVLANDDRLQEAEQAHRDAMELYERLAQAVGPAAGRWHRQELAWTHLNLANVLQRGCRTENAEVSFRQAIAVLNRLDAEFPNQGYPGWLVNAYNSLALLLSASDQSQEAEKTYRKILELKPDSAVAMNNLAWILATCPDPKFRDVDGALELAKKAVELAPHEGVYRRTLGIAYYRAGNWETALAALEQSVELGFQGGSNQFFLAMTHWRLGNKDEARKWYDQAAQWMEQNQPQNEELRRFRTEAAELQEIKVKKD